MSKNEMMMPAPLSARALAAIVDYLVVMAASIPLWEVLGSADWQFLVPLGVGALYFTLSHSDLLRGQTLGKRLFGIKVFAISESGRFLSLKAALLRYMASFGGIILLAEIPPLIFRAYGTIANPLLLEIHMFFALTYFATNVAALCLSTNHRALHDRISGATALRPHEQTSAAAIAQAKAFSASKYSYFPIFVGTLAGILIWAFSTFHAPAVSELARFRYHLEHNFSVRILSVSTSIIPAAESETQSSAASRYKLEITLVPVSVKENLEELSNHIATEVRSRSSVFERIVHTIVFRWYDGLDVKPEKRRADPTVFTLSFPQV